MSLFPVFHGPDIGVCLVCLNVLKVCVICNHLDISNSLNLAIIQWCICFPTEFFSNNYKLFVREILIIIDFFCANILEDQAQWGDKTKGLNKFMILKQCVSRQWMDEEARKLRRIRSIKEIGF